VESASHARGSRLGKPFLLLAAALTLFGCGREASTLEPGAAPAPGVTYVRLAGALGAATAAPIDVGTQALIQRGIRQAKSNGDKTLILEMDTGGGALDTLWNIEKLLVAAEEDGIEVVTWVHLHAGSAGALLTLSSKRVYMASSGTIGSAEPVTQGAQGLQELEPGVKEKITSFLRAQYASLAEKRGRPAALAIAMVDAEAEVRQVKIDGELRLVTGDEWNSLRESGANAELVRVVLPRGKLLNLTAKEAVELGFVDGIADGLSEVVAKLGLPPQTVVSPALELTNGDKLVVWLARLTPLLLLAGLVCAYLELKMPGFGVPGILAIVCFALLLVGQYLAGLADIPHIVAVAVGAALIAVEVFLVPGSLWLGITGLVLVVGGLILGSLGPGFDFSSPIDRERIVDATARILISASLALVAVLVLSRYLPKTPVMKHLVLVPAGDGTAFAGAMPEASGRTAEVARVGAVGTVTSALRPVGKVVLDAHGAHEFEARSAGPLIENGARVRVVEVSAARLVVEAAEAANSPPPATEVSP
jgi:membrane-bound serine protease (ClpP class)